VDEKVAENSEKTRIKKPEGSLLVFVIEKSKMH